MALTSCQSKYERLSKQIRQERKENLFFVKCWRKEDDFSDYEEIDVFLENLDPHHEFEGVELLNMEQMWEVIHRMNPKHLSRGMQSGEDVILWERPNKEGAKKGKWTFLTDVVYLDLDHSQNKNLVDGGPVRLDLTNFEMKAWIVTPYASYNVLDSDRVNLDLLAGARYLWLEITSKIEKQILTTTSTSSSAESDNVWDGIVGVRGAIKLDEKWHLPFHFDVGTGDSDVTWQTYAGVGYKLDNIDLALGYRHLRWDFDDGAPLQHLYVTGPMIGIKYWF